MSNRTLIPPGTQTEVEGALERLAAAMQQKPPKQRPPKIPVRKTARKRNWMFREPTPEDLELTRRIQSETDHDEDGRA